MTRCTECAIVDLGVTRIVKDDEEYVLCPNCGSEDSVEEIDADLWAEEIAEDEADKLNDWLKEDEL